MTAIKFLIGVDGGGSGTRVAIAHLDGVELARGNAGPSGLINGEKAAWQAILNAIEDAFSKLQQPIPALSQLAIGVGLAGVHNHQWACRFLENSPDFAKVILETDAYTTLLGAHQGLPGAIVAIGTGSVAEALFADGTRHQFGGWGFPSGDEASGAWLGLRAVNYCQQALDKRAITNSFSNAVLAHCGGHRDALFDWLANATQAHFAELAPLVVAHAPKEIVAEKIMRDASVELMKLITAIDSTNTLPISLCGSLAKPLEYYLPKSVVNRLVCARGDAVAGALLLIKNLESCVVRSGKLI